MSAIDPAVVERELRNRLTLVARHVAHGQPEEARTATYGAVMYLISTFENNGNGGLVALRNYPVLREPLRALRELGEGTGLKDDPEYRRVIEAF